MLKFRQDSGTYCHCEHRLVGARQSHYPSTELLRCLRLLVMTRGEGLLRPDKIGTRNDRRGVVNAKCKTN